VDEHGAKEAAREAKKRKINVQAEIERQRKARKAGGKTDVGSGLITMATSLAKGMVEAAKVRAEAAAPSSDMKELLSVMRQTQESINKGNAVQEALLKFLTKE